MRILHVVTAFPRSGDDVIVPWLVELLKRLQAAGHEVEVFTSAYRGGGNQSHEGIPVHRFRYFLARWEDLTHDEAAPDRMRRSLLYRVLPFFYVAGGLWGIWRLARRRQFDVIHVHWPVPHALFGWLARLAGAALVKNQIEISEEARAKAAGNLAQGRRRAQVTRSEARDTGRQQPE